MDSQYTAIFLERLLHDIHVRIYKRKQNLLPNTTVGERFKKISLEKSDFLIQITHKSWSPNLPFLI